MKIALMRVPQPDSPLLARHATSRNNRGQTNNGVRLRFSQRWDQTRVFAEITQARALGKHILPVKIDDCTIDPVISDRQVIDMTVDKEEAYQRLWIDRLFRPSIAIFRFSRYWLPCLV